MQNNYCHINFYYKNIINEERISEKVLNESERKMSKRETQIKIGARG
jgi:hypothetical protein